MHFAYLLTYVLINGNYDQLLRFNSILFTGNINGGWGEGGEGPSGGGGLPTLGRR